jgi:hypothetical protein
LAYAPWEPPDGFAAWLRQGRRGLGLSRRNLAARLSVDELPSAIEILPLDEGVDAMYAEIWAALEKADTPIGANDHLIAAHGLTLGQKALQRVIRGGWVGLPRIRSGN